MGLYIGTSFVTNSDGLTHKSFASVGINTNFEFVGIITASDAAAGDNFGYSVAVGSGRIVVGAYKNDIGSNSNQGSAYIYDLNGNEVGIITASDGAAGDYFGASVAVGSGRIVVGAPERNLSRGGAYIYDLDGNEVDIITASDAAAYDRFGESVAVGSGRIVVGAYADNVGIKTDQGSAYIFDLNGNQLGTITASDGAAYDYFGRSVAVGSGRIVVGASGDDIGSNSNQGSAYIYDLNGNEVGIITASDGAAGDIFGYSVAVGSGRIVVGASGHNVGSNSNQGAAYIFDLNGNQLGIITASNGTANAYFGNSVAVGSGKIVVGAYHDNEVAADAGSAHIFDLNGNQLGIITAFDGGVFDWFGYSVAVGSGRIFVGANAHRGANDNNTDQGSAYMWKTKNETLTLSDYYDEIVDHYKY